MKTDNIQTRYAQVRAGAINEENRTVEFVISTEAVDSYKTVFRLDGWMLDEYNRNPIVCYNHEVFGDADMIIGTSEVFRDGDALIGRVTFEDAETNPFAEKIFRKIKAGTLRMASINARVSKARMGLKDQNEDPDVVYFTRQYLQEWSVVSIGSNPDALKRNSEELEALRSAAVKEIEVTEEPVTSKEERASFDVFEAQLIVNQNSLVK
ncbi:MAG TPA: hypothetical protein VFM70_02640 [Salinimicrobium sp.]|nr:hypothetical protein [Salinimicrobium sp.]